MTEMSILCRGGRSSNHTKMNDRQIRRSGDEKIIRSPCFLLLHKQSSEYYTNRKEEVPDL